MCTCIQLIQLWHQYQKRTPLTIPKLFCKMYVNAEYGQEMRFHNILFQHTAPQD